MTLAAVGCSASDDNNQFGTGNSGTSGKSGSHAGGSAGASAGAGAAGANAGNGGTGGSTIEPVGPGGAGAGGTSSGTAGSSGGLQDAPPADGDAACTSDQPPPDGPLQRKCAPATTNECDGHSDIGTDPTLANGPNGNGYDDDCDGIIDEGCSCDLPSGTTRTCWLVPSSQADPTTHEPVGYCNPNSKGTVACIASGIEGQKSWDGFCKGAQFPYSEDSCAPGDFDCDGVNSNPDPEVAKCACDVVEVTCPTEPVVIGPFPKVDDVTYNKFDPTKQFIVDGYQWVTPSAQTETKNWQWTVTGGDCDNVLPHPTFAIFNGSNVTSLSPVGTEQTGLGTDMHQHGWVTPANDQAHQIFPAFSLSGDYTVQGEFDLGDGPDKHHVCTIKVQVRAPGLRVEACWAPNVDVDFHLARLQRPDGVNTNRTWFDEGDDHNDDCHWRNCSTKTGTYTVDWGYNDSNDDVCFGWGAATSTPHCYNPRLDKDRTTCNVSSNNPNDQGSGIFAEGFCGPENINIDNPVSGDEFAVAANYFANNNDVPNVPMHSNIYCNGVRVFSAGADPSLAVADQWPKLLDDGATSTGDFWTIARVRWTPENADQPCVVEPVGSDAPKSNKDGPNNTYCVDTDPKNGSGSSWVMGPTGAFPKSTTSPDPKDLCWH